MEEYKSKCAPFPAPEPDTARAEAVRATIHSFLYTDRLHRAAIEGQLADLGVHRSQHRMLVHLSRAGGSVTQGSLAKEFDISPAAVAVTLTKLERAGYVRRSTASHDGRCKNIEITAEGEALLTVSRSAFSAVDLATFASFTEEELSAFRAMLQRMQDALRPLSTKEEAPL